MRPRGRKAAFLLLAGLSAASCSRPRPTEDRTRGARLEAEWTGADSGTFAAPATAEWCDTLNLLEIRGVHGDTGVGLAIYPGERVQGGTFPVVRPGPGDSVRPSARVAVRWFGELAIRGFQGDSGAVVLTRNRDGTVGGRIDATARSVTDTGRLTVRGRFHGLPVRPASRGCVAGDSAGPGVH